MNTCILMAKVVRDPELRYTQDTQIPFSQLLVEFSGLREEDPPSTLKVVGWGEKLANEIQENYSVGDALIIEGRLSMNTFERPEGFKEKRAELRASRIHRFELTDNHVDGSSSLSPEPSPSTASPESQSSPSSAKSTDTVNPVSPNVSVNSDPEDGNLDEIPF